MKIRDNKSVVFYKPNFIFAHTFVNHKFAEFDEYPFHGYFEVVPSILAVLDYRASCYLTNVRE